jgi:hypothetical protein
MLHQTRSASNPSTKDTTVNFLLKNYLGFIELFPIHYVNACVVGSLRALLEDVEFSTLTFLAPGMIFNDLFRNFEIKTWSATLKGHKMYHPNSGKITDPLTIALIHHDQRLLI